MISNIGTYSASYASSWSTCPAGTYSGSGAILCTSWPIGYIFY